MEPDAVPEPYHGLLVHHGDMTSRLAEYHEEAIVLEILQAGQVEGGVFAGGGVTWGRIEECGGIWDHRGALGEFFAVDAGGDFGGRAAAWAGYWWRRGRCSGAVRWDTFG